jgi:hypothetical protein
VGCPDGPEVGWPEGFGVGGSVKSSRKNVGSEVGIGVGPSSPIRSSPTPGGVKPPSTTLTMSIAMTKKRNKRSVATITGNRFLML